MEDKVIKDTTLEISIKSFALCVCKGVGEAILNDLIKHKENGHAGSSCEQGCHVWDCLLISVPAHSAF